MDLQFDSKDLLQPLDKLRRDIPRNSWSALNKSLFETRKILQHEAGDSYESAAKYTLRAIRYEKPRYDRDTVFGTVYINDDSNKGNPVENYLRPTIVGNPRTPHYLQRSQIGFGRIATTQTDGRQTVVRQQGEILRPTRSRHVRRSSGIHGKRPNSMTKSQYVQILSALQGAASGADFYSRSALRNAVRLTSTNYIFIDEESIRDAGSFFGKRFTKYKVPGIFKVRQLKSGVKFNRVLSVKNNTGPREQTFDFYASALKRSKTIFAAEFLARMER